MSTTDNTPSVGLDAQGRLNTHFARDTSAHPNGWDELWIAKVTPWDKGFPNPAFVDVLTASFGENELLSSGSREGKAGGAEDFTRNDVPNEALTTLCSLWSTAGSRRPRALVPGCGKGYDVLLLSAFGFDTYGVEYSPHAAAEAKRVQADVEAGLGKTAADDVYRTRNTDVKRGNVTWLIGDFFKDGIFGGDGVEAEVKSVSGVGMFDLIYDYTFLSALPPDLRPAWSARLAALLAPQGRLICVEFPSEKPADSGGPPWALPPPVYLAHLGRPGQELAYGDNGVLLEAQLPEESQRGLRRVCHYRPKKTHAIGTAEDGRVKDYVSVWAHRSNIEADA